MRFGDRLRLTCDVAPEVLDACVPHTLLQPLVENAIKHGLEARSDAARIMVSARRDGDMPCLTIRDDGPGLDAESPRRGPGVGITNVRTRLAQLYGDRQAFRLSNAPLGGTEVVIQLPLGPRQGVDPAQCGTHGLCSLRVAPPRHPKAPFASTVCPLIQ